MSSWDGYFYSLVVRLEQGSWRLTLCFKLRLYFYGLEVCEIASPFLQNLRSFYFYTLKLHTRRFFTQTGPNRIERMPANYLINEKKWPVNFPVLVP